jgi:hypothetical protein
LRQGRQLGRFSSEQLTNTSYMAVYNTTMYRMTTAESPLVAEFCSLAPPPSPPPMPPCPTSTGVAVLDLRAQAIQLMEASEAEKDRSVEAAQEAAIKAQAKTSVGCRVDGLIGSSLPTCVSAWASILMVLVIQSVPNVIRLLKKLMMRAFKPILDKKARKAAEKAEKEKGDQGTKAKAKEKRKSAKVMPELTEEEKANKAKEAAEKKAKSERSLDEKVWKASTVAATTDMESIEETVRGQVGAAQQAVDTKARELQANADRIRMAGGFTPSGGGEANAGQGEAEEDLSLDSVLQGVSKTVRLAASQVKVLSLSLTIITFMASVYSPSAWTPLLKTSSNISEADALAALVEADSAGTTAEVQQALQQAQDAEGNTMPPSPPSPPNGPPLTVSSFSAQAETCVGAFVFDSRMNLKFGIGTLHLSALNNKSATPPSPPPLSEAGSGAAATPIAWADLAQKKQTDDGKLDAMLVWVGMSASPLPFESSNPRCSASLPVLTPVLTPAVRCRSAARPSLCQALNHMDAAHRRARQAHARRARCEAQV